MLCAPCSLNTDKYADIRRKGVMNATIMHNTLQTPNKYSGVKWVNWSTYLYFTKCEGQTLIQRFCAE